MGVTFLFSCPRPPPLKVINPFLLFYLADPLEDIAATVGRLAAVPARGHLLQVLDPAEGFIVAANQMVTASTTPFLTTEWDLGYRSQRIRERILAFESRVDHHTLEVMPADEDGQRPTVTLADDGKPYTTLGYQNGPGVTPATLTTGARPDLSRVDTTALPFLQQAAVPLQSETHGGEDVAIWARGPRAHLVRGSMEQNWVFHVMRDAFGF